MCGRYELQDLEGLAARFRATSEKLDFTTPRYNVAPGQVMPVIVHKGEQNSLEMMKWGLVPSWAKDPRIGNKMINARAETVLEKPSYRKPLQSKRCLVPVSGFYEWHDTGAGAGGKVPYHIYLKDEPVFALAGLYDTWLDPNGQPMDSYTIITTSANSFMERLHHRMPVILGQEAEDLWLDPTAPLFLLMSLMAPFEPNKMVAAPVSQRVNSVRNDDASLLVAEG
jgi:putative SOS response-associated peptidase YedK